MDKLNEEKAQELKDKYGDVYRLSSENDEGDMLYFYFRKPTRPDLARFAQELSKDLLKSTNNLVYGCLVAPDVEEVKKMAVEKPGMILALGGELQKLIGSNMDFLAEKL